MAEKSKRLLRHLRAWWLLQDYIQRGDEGGWLLTPPPCLRHVTPWRLLNWINDHSDVCWANVVMWKQFGREGSWWPDSMCFHPYDYCGKFDGKRLPECKQVILISICGPNQCNCSGHWHPIGSQGCTMGSVNA